MRTLKMIATWTFKIIEYKVFGTIYAQLVCVRNANFDNLCNTKLLETLYATGIHM